MRKTLKSVWNYEKCAFHITWTFELIKTDSFSLFSHLLSQTVRHGFPYQPSSMAFDPVQKILAIGTQSGALRLYPFSSRTFYCSPWRLQVGEENASMLLAHA